jgi:hypothetical protein
VPDLLLLAWWRSAPPPARRCCALAYSLERPIGGRWRPRRWGENGARKNIGARLSVWRCGGAPLVRLHRMKRDLPSLHPLDQYLDPIKERLIGNSRRHVPVMIDLLVDLNALVTHGPPLQAGDAANRATCGTHYKFIAIWFLAARQIQIGPRPTAPSGQGRPAWARGYFRTGPTGQAPSKWPR